MIFTDMTLMRSGSRSGERVSPAKFIYRLRPEMPTTEVAIHSRPGEDLYVIMATVDPMTQRATFQVKVRPLVWWMWPSVSQQSASDDFRLRSRARVKARIALALQHGSLSKLKG